MQKQTNYAAIFSSIAMVLALIAVFGIFNINVPEQEVIDYTKISAMVTTSMAGLNIPTAAEISSGILVDITSPEALDNSKVSDIWKVMFNDCYTSLENDSEKDVIEEVEKKRMEELKEYIEDNIVDFDKSKNIKLDEDETTVVIIEIGYCTVEDTDFGELDDDKSVIVTLVYNFKYQDTFDSTWYKDSVTVTGTVEYDEGDFDDYDVELIYTI